MPRIAAIAVWYDAKEPGRGITVAIEPSGGRSPSRYHCNASFERLLAIYRIIFDYMHSASGRSVPPSTPSATLLSVTSRRREDCEPLYVTH